MSSESLDEETPTPPVKQQLPGGVGNHVPKDRPLVTKVIWTPPRPMVVVKPVKGVSPKYPSIWSLAAYKALHGFSCFTEIVILQGLFGAASPKPTTLGICGAAHPYRVIRSFEVTKVLPPPLKMGKSSDARRGNSASYSTSALKEYPEALCKAMAILSLQWLNAHCSATVFESASRSPTDEDLRKPFMADLEGLYERGADTRGHRSVTN